MTPHSDSTSRPTVLRFVQFSDIHFGQETPGAKALHIDIRNEVIEDCKKVRKTILGPANAILITGDIAYAGQEAEYQEAGSWIDNVANAIGCGPRDVRMIPGNHDVDWSKLGAAGNALQARLRGLPLEECQYELAVALSEKDSPLVAKLDAYLSFSAAYGCSFADANKPIHEKVYPLPGGKSLRVLGLCSVLISDQKDRPDAMMLSRAQYIIPRDDALEHVVMVHHPIDWFKDKQHAGAYIQQRARLLLTGHEHLPEITKRVSGVFEQLHLAAGAMNPPAATSIHGFTYNWIEFSWEQYDGNSDLVVRVVPRVWNFAETRFDADYLRTRGTGDCTIKLRCEAARAMGPEAHLSTNVGAEKATTDTSSGSESSDEDNLSHLRFRFWRYRDRKTRQSILQELDLLPKGHDELITRASEVKAFAQALRDRSKIQELNKALGSPLTQSIDMYPRPDPVTLEQQISQSTAPIESKQLLSQSLEILRDDLQRSGYLRMNQLLEISVFSSENKTYILLKFSAEIMPANGAATVFAPGVRAPDHAKTLVYEYFVDGKRVEMYDGISVVNKVKDKLTVKYEIIDKEAVEIVDYHFWSSPVIDYTVRFKRCDSYSLEVSRVTELGKEEPIRPTASLRGRYIKFVGKPAALTAQKIKWKLIRNGVV